MTHLTLEMRSFEHGSPDYHATVQLRQRILRTPLGLTFTSEQLAAEMSDWHLGAFLGDRLVGCLILTPHTPDQVQMRQVAVDTDYQGRGIGKALVQFAEQWARSQGFHTMTLHARETAVPFYLSLGYAVVGEPFTEVTLPHRAMQRTLLREEPD